MKACTPGIGAWEVTAKLAPHTKSPNCKITKIKFSVL